MHIRPNRALVVLALSFLLAGCGMDGAPPSSSEPPRYDGPAGVLPATLIGGEENRPKIEWDSPERTDALLRNLLLGYVAAVKQGDFAAIEANYLTPEGIQRALEPCLRAKVAASPSIAWTECMQAPEGALVIEETNITDSLHAEIRFSRYDEKGARLAEPRMLPVVLTGKGPRLDDGRLQ